MSRFATNLSRQSGGDAGHPEILRVKVKEKFTGSNAGVIRCRLWNGEIEGSTEYFVSGDSNVDDEIFICQPLGGTGSRYNAKPVSWKAIGAGGSGGGVLHGKLAIAWKPKDTSVTLTPSDAGGTPTGAPNIIAKIFGVSGYAAPHTFDGSRAPLMFSADVGNVLGYTAFAGSFVLVSPPILTGKGIAYQVVQINSSGYGVLDFVRAHTA